MTCKLMTLGLILAMVFALSAMGASAARAAGAFTWSAGTTELTAEADPSTPSQVFTLTTKTGGKGSITCNEVSAGASVSGSEGTEVTFSNIVFSDTGTTPETNQCTAIIGEAKTQAEIKLNGCDLRLTAGTSVSETTTEGTLDIVCPEGKSIEVKTTGCTIKVHGGTVNEGLGPVIYHTVKSGTKKEITVEALINTGTSNNKAITYTTEGAVCGKQIEANDRKDGAYTGTVTVKGYNSTTHNAEHQTEVTAGPAPEPKFSWDEGTTHLSGEADPSTSSQRFQINPGPGKVTASFTCNEVHAEVSGLTGTGGTSLTAEGIEYNDSGTTSEKESCTGHISEAEAKVHVHMNGCHYRFHIGKTLAEAPMGETEGTADIVCSGENAIEVEAAGCFTTIGPQEGLGPVYYRTETTSPETTITAEARIGEIAESEVNKKISYSTSGVTCGKHESETNGEYTGTLTVKGLDKSNNQTNVRVT